jgi:Ca2+-binding RTX toxin-like protein
MGRLRQRSLSVRSDAFQFCNTTPIIGTDSTGRSGLYLSSINVSGFSGTVTDVNVTLLDFRTRANSDGQHWAEDIDVLVSTPSNSNVVLMPDAGGDNVFSTGPVVDADLTFDDQAATQLPAETHISSGTYRPVNDDDTGDVLRVDYWPTPASTPHSATLAAFNGINPNGTWNLWVVDDMPQAAGDFNGGWCVDIQTTGGSTNSTSTSTSMSTSTSTSTSSTLPGTTTCGGLAPTVTGTNGSDNITGTSGPDVIQGLGGDVICGGDGTDRIFGGAGNDRIFGDACNDQLFGEADNDSLAGGPGADRGQRWRRQRHPER